MESKRPDQLQWRLVVGVWHGQAFGHKITMGHGRAHGPLMASSLGSWKGLGIPDAVLRPATAVVLSTLEEHLITRYGIDSELPMKWAGEPGSK